MSSILNEKNAERFFEKIKRPHPYDDNKSYEVDFKKAEYVFNLLKCFMEGAGYGFYGFSLTPRNTNAILTVRLDNFGAPENSNFQKLLAQAKTVRIKPLDEHFLFQLEIADFYKTLSDQDDIML